MSTPTLCPGFLVAVALAGGSLASPEPDSPPDKHSGSDSSSSSEVDILLCLSCAVPSHGGILALISKQQVVSVAGEYKPLTAKEKFQFALRQSTEPSTFALAAAIGLMSQVRDTHPSFGEELGGYAHYAGTRYADYFISDLMREGVLPALLHQDPRYFRQGTGSNWSRISHAVGQVFWTRSDSGRMGFNYSQVLGGAAGIAVSTAYYPDSRCARIAANTFETQIAARMVSNLMKEFWPDLQRSRLRKRQMNHP
ncbi:MAG: hypothetical protein WBW33_33070 [Bryobacteraceae bacterium]